MNISRAQLIAISAVVLVVAIGIGLFVHQQAAHRAALAAAKSQFEKLDAAHKAVHSSSEAILADYKKMEALSDEASSAEKKRHDEFESLSEEEIYHLAKTERVNVDRMIDLQSDVQARDEVMVDALSDVYGDSVIGRYRQDLAARNEARNNGFHMWWRAATNIEDAAKTAIDGGDPGDDSSEVESEYDESARDLTHEGSLQPIVDREGATFDKRLDTDWRAAKAQVFSLQ